MRAEIQSVVEDGERPLRPPHAATGFTERAERLRARVLVQDVAVDVKQDVTAIIEPAYPTAKPAADTLRSEPAIVAGIAKAAERKAAVMHAQAAKMQAGANSGWHFLTGDPANIERIADAVGEERLGRAAQRAVLPHADVRRALRVRRRPDRPRDGRAGRSPPPRCR